MMNRKIHPGTLGILVALLLASPFPLAAQKTNGMNEGETAADAAVPSNSAMAEIKDEAGLPRVLLIGDSISIAYTLPVRELLKGKANVHRARVNCGSTRTGLAGTHGARSWLGDGKWDVIHFNFGIWDAKLNRETGLPATSKEDYVANLKELAARFRATGAQVIFATTTPIPEFLTKEPVAGPLPPKTRLFVPLPDRNAAAVAAMKEMNIPIDDLYSTIYPDREKYWKKRDLHFTPEGSGVLAGAVAESIEKALTAGSEGGAMVSKLAPGD